MGTKVVSREGKKWLKVGKVVSRVGREHLKVGIGNLRYPLFGAFLPSFSCFLVLLGPNYLLFFLKDTSNSVLQTNLYTATLYCFEQIFPLGNL